MKAEATEATRILMNPQAHQKLGVSRSRSNGSRPPDSHFIELAACETPGTPIAKSKLLGMVLSWRQALGGGSWPCFTGYQVLLLHRCKADRYLWPVDIHRCADFHDRHAAEGGHIYTYTYIMEASIILYSCGILALLVIATGFYLLPSQVSCHKHNVFHTVMVYEDKRSCGCYIRTREASSSVEEFAFA